MAIEDYEWEGELEITQPSRARLAEAAREQQSFLMRLRRSVWLEPALRRVAPARLIAAPDCGMKYLARPVAFAKLRALVEGARRVG